MSLQFKFTIYYNMSVNIYLQMCILFITKIQKSTLFFTSLCVIHHVQSKKNESGFLQWESRKHILLGVLRK